MMKNAPRLAVALVIVCVAFCATTNAARMNEKDLEVLLEGVGEIGAPGAPGPLCVFGGSAFPVVVGGSGKTRESVVAAARMGKGRVVAFGHTGYFDDKTLATADTGRLARNAAFWAAGSRRNRGAGPRAAVRRKRGMLGYLQKQGIKAESLDGSGWRDRLKQFDVFCCGAASLSDQDIAAVTKFVNAGGGLLVADLGWGWLQLNRGKTLNQHPGNRLLGPGGIVWADGTLERTSANGYSTKERPSEFCHAARALDLIVRFSGSPVKQGAGDVEQAVAVVTRAARSVPPNDTLFRPRLRAIQTHARASTVPTKDKPIDAKNPLGRLLLTQRLEEIRKLPPEKTEAHPAAAAFPGAVPADAKRVTRTVAVDTRIPRWHSTGLYAAPGDPITVTVPPEAAGKRLRVRIGAHTDRLWHKDRWRRAPEIARRFDIDAAATQAANAFGGPVYIDVPEGCELGTISVTINGAVEAPHYIHGKTPLAEWRDTIRGRPAPWAEFETSKVILTLPSEVVRELDDPASVMDLWNDIMDACAELAGWPLERKRPERYVADLQISAGYMHAGYPIMTLMDMPKVMVDRERMMSNKHGGIWGLFHETGHNHQSRNWTFSGTGEVTVNLFTMYVFEKISGTYEGRHGSISPRSQARNMRRYFAGDTRDFNQWKRDPFLALIMYIQIQKAFGWDAYKKVFAEYRNLPRGERPRSDNDKRDQWLVRLSRTVGRNLGPFFQAWGVPTSDQARASIKDLPVWMPDDFPPKAGG